MECEGGKEMKQTALSSRKYGIFMLCKSQKEEKWEEI
jgi:hypothetical protein